MESQERIGVRTAQFLEEWDKIKGGSLIRLGAHASWTNRIAKESLRKKSWEDGATRISMEQRLAFRNVFKEQLETNIDSAIPLEQIMRKVIAEMKARWEVRVVSNLDDMTMLHLRLGVSDWEAKHSSFCHSRRIPPSRSYASLTPKECQSGRMERDDEDECISPQGDQRMEEDIETKPTETITTSVYSPGCVNDRCRGTSIGCDIQSQQQQYGLSRQVPQLCPLPIVQLQGIASCFASSAPFCPDYPGQQNSSSVTPIRQ
ncbi:uncharacterized protein MONOS_14276 [Monocercomonoides exilis]|uniref:uncharacterized protein n=1 Tax=Monocercomonoides exilis TaxID=2049356 RepID=UPI003559FEF8|nr:hypothetical protein MONOS_14276 [Monocercomonoides exilis]|eukprot:MONOS_14276.1-p1 / transcript=MONOS_14276.1 / gene=MONOS_14276 / organism=Monocercomonoides_exilis_PA203 / gene_product=unspecified product / transcript_product=unspecified product / location=Mono_scaffold00969:11359-12683(-) / protein_length=260 / sequence_SO=supercontig / SO=protein_coding / is_pseudo=false